MRYTLMKSGFSLVAIFLFLSIHWIEPIHASTKTPPDVFGLKLGMSFEDAVKLLGIKADSKMQVGDKNNAIPKNIEHIRRQIESEVKQKRPDLDEHKTTQLIQRLVAFEMARRNEEISCSSNRCDAVLMGIDPSLSVKSMT